MQIPPVCRARRHAAYDVQPDTIDNSQRRCSSPNVYLLTWSLINAYQAVADKGLGKVARGVLLFFACSSCSGGCSQFVRMTEACWVRLVTGIFSR